MKIGGITFLLTLLLVVISTPSRGQTNSCPLIPSSIKIVGPRFAVDLVNTTGNQIASYRLGLTFLEVNGKKHPFPQSFHDRARVVSHGRRTAMWRSSAADQFAFPLARVYVERVTYSDGTEWLDDGSKSCSVTSTEE